MESAPLQLEIDALPDLLFLRTPSLLLISEEPLEGTLARCCVRRVGAALFVLWRDVDKRVENILSL